MNNNVAATIGRHKVYMNISKALCRTMIVATFIFVLCFSVCYAEVLPIKVTPNTERFGSVDIDWAEYDYQNKNYRVFKSEDGGNTFQSIGIDYTQVEEVKLLHIYPLAEAQNQMKEWMETNGFGRGIIKVDNVLQANFDSNPYLYLTDDGTPNGKWKYDVILIGTWDNNGHAPFFENSYNALRRWCLAGKGLILGHDTFARSTEDDFPTTHVQYWYTKLAKEFFGVENYKKSESGLTTYWHGSEYVRISKKGLLTNYPWQLGEIGTVYTIPYTHNSSQFATKANIWVQFETYCTSTAFDPHDDYGIQNFYICTYNNCGMIMTGHSNGAATVDEQKLIANLVFYLNQLNFNTYTTRDASAQDVASPNTPTFTEILFDRVAFEAEDNGSTYYYYVKSYSKDDTTEEGLIDTSEIRTIEVKTGIKGYRYAFDNNANTTLTLTTGTETTSNTINLDNNYQYLHVIAVDGAGNVSATIHYDITSFTVPIIVRKVVDVTGAITERTSASHDCNTYKITKFDTEYHWEECTFCSSNYVSAGRPDDLTWENEYLEIKIRPGGQRVLVFKNTLKTHNFTNYWTMGSSQQCNDNNIHIFNCTCGYSYSNTDGKKEHNINYSSFVATSWDESFHACTGCGKQVKAHEGKCINQSGQQISCTVSGVCRICGYNYRSPLQHKANGEEKIINASSVRRCRFCNMTLANSNIVRFNYVRDGLVDVVNTITIPSGTSLVSVDRNFSRGGGSYARIVSHNYTTSGSTITITSRVEFTSKVEKGGIMFYSGIQIRLSNNRTATINTYGMRDENNYLVPEMTAPTISNVTKDTSVINNHKLIVTGIENYCSSVNIQMIDTSSGSVVYEVGAAVTNTNYTMNLTPDIEIGSTSQQFTIKVSDTVGNSSTRTIDLSDFDRISPIFIKTTQMVEYNSSTMWSTVIPWSKTKDFSITAYDTATDYVEGKIQNVTSTRTNETFIDNFARTSVIDSTSPKRYTRDYTFTGNVKGYVTIKAAAKDDYNNTTEEYFRVYNLDNLEPEVDTPFFVGDSIDTIGASLFDAHSGIKYFGIIPYEYGLVNYPTEYPTTDSTMATELNKWYKVATIAANNSTGEPEHGQERIEVQFKITENGKFYIVTEDYVGNRGYTTFEANRFDTVPPYGTIELKDPLYSITNVKGTNLIRPTFLIDGHDDDTSVAYMSLANENSRDVISWVPYATEYAWELSANDGYKTVYVMFRDEQGNVSVSYVP